MYTQSDYNILMTKVKDLSTLYKTLRENFNLMPQSSGADLRTVRVHGKSYYTLNSRISRIIFKIQGHFKDFQHFSWNSRTFQGYIWNSRIFFPGWLPWHISCESVLVHSKGLLDNFYQPHDLYSFSDKLTKITQKSVLREGGIQTWWDCNLGLLCHEYTQVILPEIRGIVDLQSWCISVCVHQTRVVPVVLKHG